MTPDFENPYTQQASFAVQRDIGRATCRSRRATSSIAARTSRATATSTSSSGPVRSARSRAARPSSASRPRRRPPPGSRSISATRSSSRTTCTSRRRTRSITPGPSRWSSGSRTTFSINSNYTFSKAIDEVTDFNSDLSAQDPLNLRLDRALSAFDQRHRFVFSGVFQSPFEGDSADRQAVRRLGLLADLHRRQRQAVQHLARLRREQRRAFSKRPPLQPRAQHGQGRQLLQPRRAARPRFAFAETKYLELTFEAFNLLNHTNYTGVNNVVGTRRSSARREGHRRAGPDAAARLHLGGSCAPASIRRAVQFLNSRFQFTPAREGL